MHSLLSHEVRRFSDHVLLMAQMRFLEAGQPLSFYRKFQYGFDTLPDDVICRVAALPGWRVFRIGETQTISESEHTCVRIELQRRGFGTGCEIDLWATSAGTGAAAIAELQHAVGIKLGDHYAATVEWWYHDGRFLTSSSIMEYFDDHLLPSAYPWLPGGLAGFTRRFTQASAAPVLILYGPPGTGKTRLIRHLLNGLSRLRKRSLRIAYTADTESAAGDRFFVQFMADEYDAMVIEDADHMLTPRADGNRSLHRFLAVSDGLLQPHGRRLIFSTNLPSKLSIDEALMRPGRCFACVPARKLSLVEAQAVVADLHADDTSADTVTAMLALVGASAVSLADVYAASREFKHLGEEHGQELPTATGHPEAGAPQPPRIH